MIVCCLFYSTNRPADVFTGNACWHCKLGYTCKDIRRGGSVVSTRDMANGEGRLQLAICCSVRDLRMRLKDWVQESRERGEGVQVIDLEFWQTWTEGDQGCQLELVVMILGMFKALFFELVFVTKLITTLTSTLNNMIYGCIHLCFIVI